MTKHLRKRASENACGRVKHRPKGLSRRSAAKAGWTPERRAVQAAMIRRWQPWRSSTGPKTEIGKARCAGNALKHGKRSLATIREFQRIRRVLRLVDQNIAAVRLFIRQRDASARPRIKYKPWYTGALGSLLSSSYKSRCDRAAVPSNPFPPGEELARIARRNRGRFGMDLGPSRPFRGPPIRGMLMRCGGMFESSKGTGP
jgi:hypothetical protein